MKKLYFILVLSVISLFSSCYKEGPRGPMGPAGPAGKDGEDSAKLYYFDVKLKDFKPSSYNSSWQAFSFINGYTIKETDLVYAFVNLSSDGNGDNYWQALPYNEYVDNTDFFIQHSFGIMAIDDDTGNNDYLAGDIMFSLRTNTGVAPYTNMNSDAMLHYNVYIVPGTLSKKAVIPENVNPRNKEELEKYLGKIEKHKVELIR